MVTEDYCDFEIAKLLKEKGFDEQTVRCYNLKKELCRCQCEPGETINSTQNYLIAAPTLQMAMKWLRSKNIYISIDCCYDKNVYYTFDIFTVIDGKYDFVACSGDDDELFDSPVDYTYEKACENAIKYCLENLI